jgi:hypothetical protein
MAILIVLQPHPILTVDYHPSVRSRSSQPQHSGIATKPSTRLTQPGAHPWNHATRLRRLSLPRPEPSLAREESCATERFPVETSAGCWEHPAFRSLTETASETAALGPLSAETATARCSFPEVRKALTSSSTLSLASAVTSPKLDGLALIARPMVDQPRLKKTFDEQPVRSGLGHTLTRRPTSRTRTGNLYATREKHSRAASSLTPASSNKILPGRTTATQ